MQTKKIAGALGAQLTGSNLSADLTPSLACEIRGAPLEYQVIFIAQQDLTPTQFFRFAQAMGEPVEYPFVKA